MRALPGAVVLVLALAPYGCGGGPSATPATPTARVISVGGTYEIAVALRENACGAVEVAPLPTRVDHTPGATRFQLTHGPVTYNGTLSPDGRFTTDPANVTDGRGVTSTLLMDGRFTTGGLEADVTVQQQPPTPACRYVVHWIGTKQGAPNTLP